MNEPEADPKPVPGNVTHVSILGATGSVGVNTLKVIEQHATRFSVTALTANNNIDLLYEQCLKFRPGLAVVANEKLVDQFSARFSGNEYKPDIHAGNHGLELAASLDEVDFVMAAIVGAAGLPATLAAAQAGKRILLANKEALVMSGGLLMDMANRHAAKLLPIDSEHNAVFQCLSGSNECEVEKIILTASGGPFLKLPLDEFAEVTPQRACAHPNWEMGKKISVDSATMMNKGLEVIEACMLFEKNANDIEVVIHPQSIIHSLVAYVDGSILAHLAYPDMRVPIAHALAWPQRIRSGISSIDLAQLGPLEFTAPDRNRFPCLQLAYQVLEEPAGSAAIILNAANEVAVGSFLKAEIRFTEIPVIIDAALQHVEHENVQELEMILTKDKQTRLYAKRFIEQSILRHS